MGKVYSSQNGVMRGRIGSTIYRKGQRAVVASQYQPQVSNPRSLGQAVQRCAFATATAAQAALASIVDHSHYGLSDKRANLQRFVQQNAEMLRGSIIGNMTEGAPFWGLLNIKGVRGIQPAPYKISEGTLPFQPASELSASSVTIPSVDSQDWEDTLTTQAEYEAILAAFGLVPGDQISFIGIYYAGYYSGQYGEAKNMACHVLRSRVTFATTLPSGFDGAFIVNGKFNDALITRSEGNMVVDGSNYGHIKFADARQGNDDTLVAACVVRSQLDVNGRYNYSSTSMLCGSSIPGYMFPAPADIVTSFTNQPTEDVSERPFLDNPGRPFVGSDVSAAVISVEVDGLPNAFNPASEPEFEASGIDTMPTSLYLRFAYNAVQQTSPNLVSAGDTDNLVSFAGQTVNKSGEVSIEDSTLKFGLIFSDQNTGSMLVLGGYGILPSGQRFEF